MQNARILWNNLLDSAIQTYSSQHPNFPASNAHKKHRTKMWRSRYGATSNWGYFLVEIGVNDALDFDEGGAELQATLTAGAYSATTLCTEIKTRMDALGALTYTVTYSDVTNKFTIAATGNFTIRWNTGTNAATNCADLLGYDDSADDDGGSASFTADYIRIHSEEWLKWNLGSAQDILAFAVLNHNLSSTGTMKIQLNNADVWTAPAVSVTLSLNANIIVYFWSSTQSYQWVRYYINDVDNSELYTQVGRAYIGTYHEFEVNYRRDYTHEHIDPSDIMESEGGQITTNRKTIFQELDMVFEYMTAADLAELRTIFNSRGQHKEIFFCRDADSANSTTLYSRFTKSLQAKHIVRDETYTVPMSIRELL